MFDLIFTEKSWVIWIAQIIRNLWIGRDPPPQTILEKIHKNNGRIVHFKMPRYVISVLDCCLRLSVGACWRPFVLVVTFFESYKILQWWRWWLLRSPQFLSYPVSDLRGGGQLEIEMICQFAVFPARPLIFSNLQIWKCLICTFETFPFQLRHAQGGGITDILANCPNAITLLE